MSKVSFERTIDVVATPVADVTVESVTTVSPATPVAITPVVSSPVPESSVPARINSPIEFDDQNIGFEDIILPRINLVHKVGGLSEIFNSGEIVLKQTLVIYSPGRKHPDPALVIPADAPLNLVILGFKKVQFAEKVVAVFWPLPGHHGYNYKQCTEFLVDRSDEEIIDFVTRELPLRLFTERTDG